MDTNQSSLRDPIFKEHPEFARLLAGAHRRRVTTMGAPALTRHVAFWNPRGTSPRKAEESALSADVQDPAGVAQRTLDADATIRTLYASLCRTAAAGRSECIVSGLETSGETVLGGKRLILLFAGAMSAEDGAAADLPKGPDEVRPDTYRAIKIRFLWRGIKTSLNFELHTEFLALSMVVDTSPHKSEEEIERGKRLYGKPFADLLHSLDALSNDLADDECKRHHLFLYHEVWDRFSEEILFPLRDDASLSEKKFVDFRGLVLGAQDPQGTGFSRPFSRAPSERSTGKEIFTPLDMDRFDSFWKFNICALPPETEFTLSKFLGGRAFYATALGSQSEMLSAGAAKPLYYMIYEATQSPWQLGRLVYRVHRAGTARIAATMQFEDLKHANEVLSVIEEELEERIPRLLKTESGDEDENIKFRDSLSTLYRDVETRMGQLSRAIDGTIEARIERSRYYVKQFFTVTAALRIKRFCGFQKYDEFVLQRLGPVFDHIDAVGRKYERVQSDRSLLLGRIQTLDALIQQRQISEAQRIADIALSCALGPYYVGSIVAHAFEDIVHHKWVWLYALLFGAIMFGLIMAKERNPEGWFRERSVRFGAAFGVTLVVELLIYAFAMWSEAHGAWPRLT